MKAHLTRMDPRPGAQPDQHVSRARIPGHQASEVRGDEKGFVNLENVTRTHKCEWPPTICILCSALAFRTRHEPVETGEPIFGLEIQLPADSRELFSVFSERS